MADVEQWRPEVEEGAESGLKLIATVKALPNNEIAPVVSPKEVANGHGLDKNGDADILDILEFYDIGTHVDGATNGSEIMASQLETRESFRNGEVIEEEIVELEFQKAVSKLATHSMHCPNCKSEITKVVLRRKVLLYRPEPPVAPVAPEPEPEPEGLVGCLSCLSLFTSSDNGSFKPLDIFRKRPVSSSDPASPPSDGEKAKPVLHEKESCFSMFWVIQKEKSNQKLEDSQQTEAVTSKQVKPITNLNGTTTVGPDTSGVPYLDLPVSSIAPEIEETAINIVNGPETIVVAQSRGRSWLGYEGVLGEILKSVVYGGLMEEIASFSVVASAAASDASTLSIISLALASVIGGVFVIGHNLWDLRDDCYKDNSSHETNKEATNKYKELFGEVKNFPLHVFFAVLSFLVFGMVPPIAYAVTFYETNDKDFTLVVVAIASGLCVSLLAIFKSYINKCAAFEYFKTMMYYITTMLSVSGVSYVAGNLLTRLMEEFGFFNTSSGGGMSILSHPSPISLASF